ncbi:hypothetical protein AZ09_03100 [Acetobacter aceti 1023]|nr:hypothetical protein AZ09_03100 [Acetobacter aceti 1023]
MLRMLPCGQRGGSTVCLHNQIGHTGRQSLRLLGKGGRLADISKIRLRGKVCGLCSASLIAVECGSQKGRATQWL